MTGHVENLKLHSSEKIKVKTIFHDVITPTSMDIKISLLSEINSEHEKVLRQQLLAKFEKIGISINSRLVGHQIKAENNSLSGFSEDKNWDINLQKIDTQKLSDIKKILRGELGSSDPRISLNCTFPREEKEAQEKAIIKNRIMAENIASTQRVSIVGVNTENVIFEYGIPENFEFNDNIFRVNIIVKVEIEYFKSRFSHFRYNVNVLKTANKVQIIKKQIIYKVFEFWFQLNNFWRKLKTDNNKFVPTKRAIVVGHFSFPAGGGTFGDIEALEIVCDWLEESNVKFDVVSNREDGVNGIPIMDVDEKKYGIFIFVCGPWYVDGRIHKTLLNKFEHCTKIGINLTTFDRGNSGFDYLISRDNSFENHVDIAFAKAIEKIPVVGFLLVDRQKKYGYKQGHLYIRKVISKFLGKGSVAPIWLDTNVKNNIMQINKANQFESIISRVDLVVTNRLHGVVLCLKNSVPVIAIDPVIGGSKVTAQIKALGWPIIIPVEEFNEERLQETINYCLNENMNELVKKSQELGRLSNNNTKEQFMKIFHNMD